MMLLHYSIPSLLTSVVVAIGNWAPSAMLAAGGTDGLVQVGIFNAANQWFLAVMFLPLTVGQVFLPVLSRSIGTGDWDGVQRKYRLSLIATLGFVIPVVFAGAIAGHGFMALYGADYAGHWRVLSLSIAAGGIAAIAATGAAVLAAAGRVWITALLTGMWLLVTIGCTVLFLGRGAEGVAIARTIGYAVLSLPLVWLGYKVRGPPIPRPVGLARSG